MLVDAEPVRVTPETPDRAFGWTSIEVVEMLSEGGMLDRDRLYAQMRGLVRRGLLHPVALFTGDAKGAYLYREPEVFTAAALGRLLAHGLNGPQVAHAALALNDFIDRDWPEGRPFLRADPSTRARTPAEWLVDGFMTGVAGWALEVVTVRQGDSVAHSARLRNAFAKAPNGRPIGTNWTMGEGFEIIALTAIDLDDVLSRLFGVVSADGASTH